MDFWELPPGATVGSHLLAIKAHAGRSLAEIAKDAGYAGRSSAQAFFREDYSPESLPLEVATRLIPALSGHGDPKVRPEDILRLVNIPFEAGGAQSGQDTLNSETAAAEAAASPTIPVYSQSEIAGAPGLTDLDLPIGSSISGLDLDSPIDWFFRPRPLKFTSGVYGLYVGHESMAPRFESGDVILLDPRRPAKAGEDVLVFLNHQVARGGLRPVLLARLIARNARSIELQQFTPSARFTVKSDDVARIHRVFSTAELLFP
jgi:hypothetical protein